MRILQNDSSYITLADIYEQYCEETGIQREDPLFMMGEKVRAIMREFRKTNGRLVSVYFADVGDVSKSFLSEFSPIVAVSS